MGHQRFSSSFSRISILFLLTTNSITWWKRSPMILRKRWRVSKITCMNGIEINGSWIEPFRPSVVFLYCSSYIVEDSSQLASLVLKKNYKTECWLGKCQINIAFCIYSHIFKYCRLLSPVIYLCFLTCKHPSNWWWAHCNWNMSIYHGNVIVWDGS